MQRRLRNESTLKYYIRILISHNVKLQPILKPKKSAVANERNVKKSVLKYFILAITSFIVSFIFSYFYMIYIVL